MLTVNQASRFDNFSLEEMEILMTKIIASGFIVALSLFFGFLPQLLTRRYCKFKIILESI